MHAFLLRKTEWEKARQVSNYAVHVYVYVIISAYAITASTY